MTICENGSDPDHKLAQILGEITDRLQADEEIDVSALASQYPEFADELLDYLPSMQVLADLGRSQSAASNGRGDSHTDVPPEDFARCLGDFRIIREIGRGGMGIVYRAEQISLGREVALKVLPFASVLDEKAIARFKNEARAAGTLRHPNIVPVHAVGNERGVYYYAMDLVEGLSVADVIAMLRMRVAAGESTNALHPLVEQALSEISREEAGDEREDANPRDPTLVSSQTGEVISLARAETQRQTLQAALSTNRSHFERGFFDRVARLGRDVAEALHHAHEHGIVHRDIKPGNLMLDAAGKALVTDFGLARIESDAGMTMTGDLVGTLRYMAPEQALAKRVMVDHRADIYSLGATLYELLCLQPMFDGATREALLKQLAFEEPKKLRHLHPGVPTDLATIVQKAVSKDPEERYASAEAMASDLRAFHENEPIKARPPTLSQTAGRWAKRHKPLVASVAVVLLLTTVGLAIGTVLLERERRRAEAAALESDIAAERERQQKVVAQEERDAAEMARVRAETTKEFMINTFQSPDPERDGESIRVVEVLEQGEKELEKRFDDEPKLKGKLLFDLGQTYLGLGAFKKAVDLNERALTLAKTNYGQEDPETLKVMTNLGNAYVGTGHLDQAQELLTQVLETRQSDLGNEHPDTLVSMLNLGNLRMAEGQPFDASKIFKQTLQLNQKLQGTDHPATVATMESLAEAYMRLGQHAKAVELYEQAFKLKQNLLGAEDPKTLRAINNLAAAYNRAGRHGEAIELLEKSLELQQRILGTEHADTFKSITNLAIAYNQSYRYDDAIALLERAREPGRKTSGLEYAVKRAPGIQLANAYDLIGRQDKSIALLERTVELNQKSLGKDHAETLASMTYLASAYANAGRKDKAIELHQATLQLRQKTLGTEHPLCLASMTELAGVYASASQHAQAIELHDQVLRTRRDVHGPEHPNTLAAMKHVVFAYIQAGRYEEVRQLREQLFSSYKRTMPKRLIAEHAWLGRTLLAAGEPTAAFKAWQRVTDLALQIPEKQRGPSDWGYLGQALYESGQRDQARTAIETSLSLLDETRPNIQLGPRWWYLGMLDAEAGEIDEARDTYDTLIEQLLDATSSDRHDNETYRARLAGLLET